MAGMFVHIQGEFEMSENRAAWSVQQIVESTGLSEPFIRGEIRRGVLPSRHFGRRVLVLNSDLETYLNQGGKGRKQDEEDSEAA